MWFVAKLMTYLFPYSFRSTTSSSTWTMLEMVPTIVNLLSSFEIDPSPITLCFVSSSSPTIKHLITILNKKKHNSPHLS